MDVHPSRKSDVIEERGVGGAPTGMHFLTEFGRKLAGMKKSYSVGAPPPLALRRGVEQTAIARYLMWIKAPMCRDSYFLIRCGETGMPVGRKL
jgi:hypothetical protein